MGKEHGSRHTGAERWPCTCKAAHALSAYNLIRPSTHAAATLLCPVLQDPMNGPCVDTPEHKLCYRTEIQVEQKGARGIGHQDSIGHSGWHSRILYECCCS